MIAGGPLIDSPSLSISVIIPTLNEESNLSRTLEALGNRENTEVIVVDGASEDQSPHIAQELGALLIKSERGRARQMNYAARHAAGQIFLFLHADTILPQTWASNIREALKDADVCGGAFTLGIEGNSLKLRLIERLTNFRSRRFLLPYGDQGIFVRSGIFREMGGFPEITIMEDFEFMRRLRKKGVIRILSDRVITSGRRWERLGVFRTAAINQGVILGYYVGVPPEKLARFYRGGP